MAASGVSEGTVSLSESGITGALPTLPVGLRLGSNQLAQIAQETAMFRPLVLVPLALSACMARPQPAPVASSPATMPIVDTVTIHLSNFAFTPDNIRLQAGQAVTLVLINDANGGHNFSAPTLFAASTFPAGTAPPKDGAQEVGRHSQVELRFTPQKPGQYEVTCTHFMHEMFGMTGNVDVLPAS